MGIIRRLWALFLYVLGTIMLTIGLPISALWWLLSGDFWPFIIWEYAEEYS